MLLRLKRNWREGREGGREGGREEGGRGGREGRRRYLSENAGSQDSVSLVASPATRASSSGVGAPFSTSPVGCAGSRVSVRPLSCRSSSARCAWLPRAVSQAAPGRGFFTDTWSSERATKTGGAVQMLPRCPSRRSWNDDTRGHHHSEQLLHIMQRRSPTYAMAILLDRKAIRGAWEVKVYLKVLEESVYPAAWNTA